MSLNFDFTAMIERLGKDEYDRITDHPTQDDRWHPITDALIWYSLITLLNSITEENVDEWTFRIGLLQCVGAKDGDVSNSHGDAWVTEADIKNHIGMRTNVTPKKRSAWLNSQFGRGTEGRIYPPSSRQEGSGHEKTAQIIADALQAEQGREGRKLSRNAPHGASVSH